ncbi:MAG: MFS transporter [Aquificaceae bacterium]|nr:MFS transporter [Aquificaceae bacterium]MDW8237619.1 MFS transporter [Aquificaceae bacterium]
MSISGGAIKRSLAFGLFDAGETALGAILISTLFPLYISNHIPTKVYTLLYGLSMVVSFVLALLLAKVADEKSIRKRLFSTFGILTSLFCALIALSLKNPYLGLLVFLLMLIFKQQSLVFYASLLGGFEKRGLTSGIGVSMGYLGASLSLVFFAPRLELPSGALFISILFLALLLPAVMILDEPKKLNQEISILKVLKSKKFSILLLSCLLVMEVASTMSAIMGIYLKEVYNLEKKEIYLTIAFSAFGGVFSGPIFGYLTDKLGPSRIFPLSFILWACFLVLLFLTPKELIRYLGLFAGLCLAHLWTSVRALIIHNSEGDFATKMAMLSLSERLSMSIGPIIWSLLLTLTLDNYRLSALLMVIFPALGGFFYLISRRV